MIAAFVLLFLLGIGLVMLWIVWWLVADLAGGAPAARPARITNADEASSSVRSTRRAVISH